MAGKSYTKTDLVGDIADAGGLTKSEGERVADAIVRSLGDVLRGGGRIEIRGFGAFSVKETKPRKGRNPKTGETVDVPAGRKVVFKPSKSLLEG